MYSPHQRDRKHTITFECVTVKEAISNRRMFRALNLLQLISFICRWLLLIKLNPYPNIKWQLQSLSGFIYFSWSKIIRSKNTFNKEPFPVCMHMISPFDFSGLKFWFLWPTKQKFRTNTLNPFHMPMPVLYIRQMCFKFCPNFSCTMLVHNILPPTYTLRQKCQLINLKKKKRFIPICLVSIFHPILAFCWRK